MRNLLIHAAMQDLVVSSALPCTNAMHRVFGKIENAPQVLPVGYPLGSKAGEFLQEPLTFIGHAAFRLPRPFAFAASHIPDRYQARRKGAG